MLLNNVFYFNIEMYISWFSFLWPIESGKKFLNLKKSTITSCMQVLGILFRIFIKKERFGIRNPRPMSDIHPVVVGIWSTREESEKMHQTLIIIEKLVSQKNKKGGWPLTTNQLLAAHIADKYFSGFKVGDLVTLEQDNSQKNRLALK